MRRCEGAVLAAPIVDTVKRERGGIAVDTVDRQRIVAGTDAAGVRIRGV